MSSSQENSFGGDRLRINEAVAAAEQLRLELYDQCHEVGAGESREFVGSNQSPWGDYRGGSPS
jgi:hypothetical protein